MWFIQPENLLIDDDGNIKICDFGWSAEENGNRKTFCGTMEYMSPEMIRNQVYPISNQATRLPNWYMGTWYFAIRDASWKRTILNG